MSRSLRSPFVRAVAFATFAALAETVRPVSDLGLLAVGEFAAGWPSFAMRCRGLLGFEDFIGSRAADGSSLGLLGVG